MIEVLSVFIGGFFGAASRYVLQIIFNRLLPAVSIPVSILLINLIGSFGLGMVLPAERKLGFIFAGFSDDRFPWRFYDLFQHSVWKHLNL